MNAVASMTGFARVDGAVEGARWTWEIRSVNSRGLDIRVRAPGFVDQADKMFRKAATGCLKRGSLQASLTVERDDASTVPRIDRAALQGLLDDLAGVTLPESAAVAPARLDGLLQIKGVMQTPDSSEATDDYRTAPLSDIPAVLDALQNARLEEGARLATMLTGVLDEIGSLAGRATRLAADQPEALAAKYREAIQRLVAEAAPAPEERIIQEAAAMAVKADITEELDRLAAHVAQARELLSAGGPVGRRLDFLAQEFNREANTLGSKSTTIELTRISMDLKAAIDAFREQVQNVE